MPYVGTSLATNFASTLRDNFTGDGSATAFTLSRNAHHENDLEVFVGNVRQQPGSAYNVSGTTLTFTGTPASGEVIYVVHQAGALQTIRADADHGNRDFKLSGDSNKITFGVDSDVTLTHVPDSGLAIKSIATADDKPVTLVLQTGETDIAANDKIGVINFQAPDEGAGTDAILVAAGIEAVSEGDFSSSNNATKLSFLTGSSGAATEKMSISSGGNVAVAGNMDISGNLDVTGTVSFSENNVTDVGIMSLDTLRGDADTDTSIVFSGSNVITITTGGTTAATFNASQILTLSGNMVIPDGGQIGSASDTDAIAISSAGVVTISTNTDSTSSTSGAIIAHSAGFADDVYIGDDLYVEGGLISLKNTGSQSQLRLYCESSNAHYAALQAPAHSDFSGNTVLTLPATTDTIVGRATTDTMTNKTLTSPVINTGTFGTSILPVSADGTTLGSASKEFSDLFLADASTIQFGADQDVTLTHVADTGLLLNTTMVIQFRDSAINIGSPADGDLDINADDEIELNTTLVDLNGNLDVSGTALVTGVLTTTAATVFNGGFASNADSTMATNKKIIFRDAAIHISSTADGDLSIAADDEIDLTSTLIDVNGNLDVSGNIDVDGTSNLDVVDIDGAVDMASTLQVDGAITGSSTIQGTTITATTAFVPDASGGADLGSTSLEFGDVFIADDKAIKLGSDQDATIEYDEDGTDRLIIGGANVTFGKSVLGSVETANKTGDSVALDFATYQNFLLTFTGNVTLTNPTTETVGQSGYIVIKQDGTGSRTLSIGTQYVTVGDAAYTLSTAAAAIDLIPYVVQADGVILLGTPSLAFA